MTGSLHYSVGSVRLDWSDPILRGVLQIGLGGGFYVDGGLYAEQVKAYTDNFERVLLLLFEEDVVTGQATEKILNFLNIVSLRKAWVIYIPMLQVIPKIVCCASSDSSLPEYALV